MKKWRRLSGEEEDAGMESKAFPPFSSFSDFLFAPL